MPNETCVNVSNATYAHTPEGAGAVKVLGYAENVKRDVSHVKRDLCK